MITGISSDGHFVIDDAIDSSGRQVTDSTNRLLSDGTEYFAISTPPGASEVTGLTLDGHFVFDDKLDDIGRQVTAVGSAGVLGMLIDGTQYTSFDEAAPADFQQSLSDSLGLSEAFNRAVAIARGDNLVLTENLIRHAGRAVSDSLGLSEDQLFQAQKRVSESVSLTESFTANQVRLITLSDTLSLGESLLGGTALEDLSEGFELTETQRRQVQKRFAESIALSETLRKHVTRSIAETLDSNETVGSLAVKLAAMGDTLALTESLTKTVIRGIAETPGLSEQLTAAPSAGGTQHQRQFGDTVDLSETMTRQDGKALAEDVTLSENWQRRTSRAILESVGLSETMQPLVARLLGFSDSIAFTEQLQQILVRLTGITETMSLSEQFEAEKSSSLVRPVKIFIQESLYQNTTVILT